MINSVLGKLRSKSGRNALSLLLYYVLILYITPHLSEVQNFQLDCVEVDLHEKNTCSSYYQRLVMSLKDSCARISFRFFGALAT